MTIRSRTEPLFLSSLCFRGRLVLPQVGPRRRGLGVEGWYHAVATNENDVRDDQETDEQRQQHDVPEQHLGWVEHVEVGPDAYLNPLHMLHEDKARRLRMRPSPRFHAEKTAQIGTVGGGAHVGRTHAIGLVDVAPRLVAQERRGIRKTCKG